MKNRIRRGGIATKQGYLFELSGGDLSLDFVNTVDSRPLPQPRELLNSYTNLLSWSNQVGLLNAKQEFLLRKKAKSRPAETEKARKLALHVRECLFRLFFHLTENQNVPADLMNEWNRLVRKSMTHYQMVPGENGLRWKQLTRDYDFESILWPIIHAAVKLLIGDRANRIRRCASAKCDWMFLDTSKRGNRRWCDMTVCGNRAKASRFYSKKKKRR
jgi:predicted RNA-binding Zn ribbon-like protein